MSLSELHGKHVERLLSTPFKLSLDQTTLEKDMATGELVPRKAKLYWRSEKDIYVTSSQLISM